MLQVIKAEEVRDGEPRIWIETPQPVMHTESRRDRGCQPCGFAIVDRPAPTPSADPLATVRAALDASSKATPGPWRYRQTPRWLTVSTKAHDIVAPTLAPVARDMTPGDADGICDLLNAAPAIAELCAEVERLRAERDSARDSMATAHVTAAQVGDELIATRSKLAEAKRLGLEACALVHSAIDNAPDPTSNDPGDQSAIAAGHSVTDRIAAALEAL